MALFGHSGENKSKSLIKQITGSLSGFIITIILLAIAVNAVASTFWRVSNARVALNRMTLAYTLPKSWLGSIGINSCRINITGQNLINFYNPYPDKFMNPMAGSYGNYPNLRKWTVGVNLSF